MLRTLIVDDEEPARERLRAMLGAHGQIEIVAEADNGIAAIEKMEALDLDLVFLDIQMPGCSGIEAIRAVTKKPLPRIIFCTAYDQYALTAFELNAADYLLKPVSRARLAEAIERVAGRGDEHKISALLAALREPKYTRRFLGRQHKKIYPISEGDVIYFRVDGNLVFIVTAAGEYWTSYTLAELESAADPEIFLRSHRQYMINLEKIKEMEPLAGGGYSLTMTNGHKVEVSRRQSKRLLEMLK